MTEETTDEQLMAVCRGELLADSRTAFAELAGRWEGRIYSYLVKVTRQPEEAFDLRQEVFLRVWRYRASFRSDGAFSHWLFRIAANALRDWLRRKQVRAERSLDEMREEGWTEPDDPAPGPGDSAVAGERREALDAALAQLSVEDRQILLLRFYDDCNYRHLSEILELPETTVKSRVYRLLKRLRVELEPRCDTAEEVRT